MSDVDAVAALGLESGWEQRLSERATRLHAKDLEFRAAAPLDSVVAEMRRPSIRLVETVEAVIRGYADRPAVGQRRRELADDPDTGLCTSVLGEEFGTVSYRELWSAVEEVAAGWAGADNPPQPGDFVCFLGFGSVDYAVVDLACLRQGLVSVPLPAGAPAPTWRRSWPRLTHGSSPSLWTRYLWRLMLPD